MRRCAAVLGLCLSLLGGCIAIYPDHPPVPPIRAERVPAPPPLPVVMIWQPGHYDWNGADYLWIPGVWIPRDSHGTLWQDGYWQQNHQASVWVPAHWI